LILLIGSLTGFFSGFLGVGGGFILVPLLIFMGVPAHEAIGSSLAYIVFIGITGAFQHYRQKNCNIRIALVMLCGGVITAQIGAIATSYLSSNILEIFLAIILLGTAFRMMVIKDKETASDNEVCKINVPMAILIGSVAGFLSGLLGVGGGFILVPLTVLILKIPIHIAVGTSLVNVMGLAASGAVRHWMMGNVNLLLVGILVIGGVISSQLGAMVTKRANAKQLRYIFCTVLFLFAITLLIPVLLYK
jgi:uncharacterized membrane protein YfcA